MIGQILEYNTVVTKAEFLFMIQSVNLPPSAHTITFSAHCSSHYIFSPHFSHVQPCTAICSQSSVHTAANYSHLQPPTLQLFYPVHTAAILSSAHCSYSIQCTLQLNYLYSTSSAPLSHHRVSLYHYWPTSRAVSRH